MMLFNNFLNLKNFNLIGYILEVETENNVVKILTNENIFTISLYQNQNKINVCNKNIIQIYIPKNKYS